MTNEIRQGTPDLTTTEVAARLRWARQSGHPFYVWPDVARDAWQATLTELGRVAGAVLSGQSNTRLERPQRLTDREWIDALHAAAFTSGTGPLLGWWCERGLLAADGAASAALAEHLAHGRARATRMAGALVATISVLNDARVDVTVLKGSHTARYCFVEPGVRPMSDLDVMVSERDAGRAEAALRAAGYGLVEGSRVARPYRSDWRPPGAPTAIRSFSIHHRDNPFTVDLHTTLELDFFGVRTIRFEVEGMRAEAAWAGPGATVLAQPLLVAHLATHASQGLHNLTLLRIIELALVLQRDAQKLFGWHELSALLQRANAERFVFPAFELVERLVPGTVQREFLERLARAATPAQRAIVAGLTPATAQRLQQVALDERFMWGATSLEHVRRVLHMIAPAGTGSWRRLRRIYVERAFRLIRGRVSLRGS